MTAPRSPLIELLQTAFKDPKIKTQCLSSKISKTTTRVFDDFPDMLTKSKIDALCENFKAIIKTIPTDGEMAQLSDDNKKAIQTWEKEIANLGLNDLINKSTLSIDPEIIKLLEWEQYVTKIMIVDVLCAYFGRMNASIISNSSDFIKNNIPAVSAAVVFINANYRSWIMDELKRSTLVAPINPKYQTWILAEIKTSKLSSGTNEPLISLSQLEKTAIAVSVTAGLFAAGALLYMKFFSQDPSSPLSANGADSKAVPSPHK
jgi:hypothetical protein